MMVKKPGSFLSLFLFMFMIMSGIALKILEQGAQQNFEDILGVIWFTLVTVTTGNVAYFGEFQFSILWKQTMKILTFP